ncbi:MAG: excinuclease ABC subunit UvrC [Candidatus Altimarinota bacterium]
MNKVISHQLKNIPHQPGVYKMKNVDGKIIYVGKAKDLYKRVNSYFKKVNQHPPRTQKLVENITDLEYIIVNSDLEALVLETNLIKEYRPKYNILMKDDKNFAYIKITTQEDYPRILVVRKVLKDKAKYFGPKTAASRIYYTLKTLRKIFPYRNCNLNIEDLGPTENTFEKKRQVKITHASIKYPCLDLHIKRCLAPCVGRPSKEEYQEIINRIIDFLDGKYQEIIDQLKAKMQDAALNKRFEQAAKLRDQISAIENIYQDQLVSSPDHLNSDILNYYPEDQKAYFNLFQIRDGKLVDQQNIIIDNPDLETPAAELIGNFIQQFYSDNTNLPAEILVPEQPPEPQLLETWLTDLRGHKVKINIPSRGKKDHLLDLSLENAKSFALQSRAKWEGESKPNRELALENLAQILGLSKIPQRIECYDISHLSGTNTVASMSVFENGFPKKDQYRHFKISINTAGSPDDFASMEEVILRRLKYLKPSIQTKGFKVIKQRSIIPKKSESEVKQLETNEPVDTTAPCDPENPEIPQDIYQVSKDKATLLEFKVISSNKLKTCLEYFPTPTENFDIIIKKILDKFTSKRIYLIIQKKELRQFETLGFQEVQVNTENIPLEPQQILIVFDKTRNFEDKSFKKIPDLIVIDGGKGQLSHAVKAMEDHKLIIPIISLAKKQEEFFLPGQTDSIRLESNNQSRLLIQHIRDEAHRFAIEYNRKLRSTDYTKSQLEEISGIGKILTQKLLRKFGSVDNLKNQPESEIAKVVGTKVALKIKSALN